MSPVEEAAEAGAIKAIESPKFGERIASIFTGKLQKDLSEAQSSITAKDGEITKLKSDLAAANQRAEKAEADLAKAKEDHTKALEAKEKDVETRANTIAGEKISKAGHRPVQPENTEETAKETQIDELRKQINASKDPKEKHRLAMKINKLRAAKAQ